MSRKVRQRSRGQAMLEYSMINWLVIVALVLSSTVRIIPGPRVSTSSSRPPMSLIEMFLYAYQVHYDTYLYSLSLPFP
ncbi:MAG: hypothetical protein Q8L48_41075 [Archangium sp.]|nr:hypothetical protein [Archangium sp.]